MIKSFKCQTAKLNLVIVYNFNFQCHDSIAFFISKNIMNSLRCKLTSKSITSASIEDTVQAPSSQPPYNSHIIQAPNSKSLDEISSKKYHTFIEQYHTCFPTN